MMKAIFDKSYSVFIAASLIMFVFYHHVLLNLNSVIFASGGDGLKNYYTFMFQAKYGQNFWEFKGMNYPFYEHIVYTDATPLLSFIVSKLGLADYGVGILNFLMLLSYPISAVFLYKILKYYRVSYLWAFLSSLTICFMAPQVFRLTGHLSLSYVFAIPLMWWIILKVQDFKTIKWPLALFFLLFTFFFIHPYLGLILAIFGLTYALVFTLFNRKKWLFYTLNIGLPVLSAIAIFKIIVSVTDTHLNRMKTPAGFFNYYADWSSLLIPHHGPMNDIKTALNIKLSGWEAWESWTYLGLFTIITLITGVIYFIYNRKTIRIKNIVNSPIGKIYIVGHLVLLFSFCFPLKYDFLRWIVDALGPLKQFRVLGRFAWVYFYIASVSAVILIQYFTNNSKSKSRYWKVFYFIGISFSILEFYSVHHKISQTLSRTNNLFKIENISANLLEVIDWSKGKNYDAIIFLPFAHFSSENIFILGEEKANSDAMLLSYHTNLPLLNTLTSRNSVSESVLFQNLFSPEFIEKELLNIIGKDKKIMLIKNKNALDNNELRMIWSSKNLFTNSEYGIYEITQDSWNGSKYFDTIIARDKKATNVLKDNWRSDTLNVDYRYYSFDDLKEKNAMAGGGAFAGQKTGINLIIPEINGLKNGKYSCSFWYNFMIDRADQLAIIEQKFKNGKGEWVVQKSIRETNFIVGDWAFVEMEFEISDSVVETKLLLAGNSSKKWFVIDEVLIRNLNDHSLFKDGKLNNTDYLIYNNHWIKKNSFSK